MKLQRGQLLILGLFATLSTQWIVEYGSTSFFENSLSFASKNGRNRSTQLGKPIPTKNKPESEMEVILNDPAISSGWGLKMTNVQNAWRISQGSRDIKVCVIDTGAQIKHPDLKNNLWSNPGEVGLDDKGRDKSTNKIDDDGNGFVDDVHGWNFVNNNNDLNDDHGHGTHIAGIIGAEGGNGIGISGVSPKVSLVILKYYDAKGNDTNNLINTVKSINYAVDMNCNIINYSGGGTAPSSEERAAIERANKKGILFVAAAGNERSNSDVRKYYPADYGLPNILSVTAIDRFKNILPSSNFGEQTVDIAAPGNDIISTLPNGQYGYMTGTSQATAFATGVAALIMANNTQLRTAANIRKYMTQTGDTDEKLIGKTRWRKRLNSYRALAIQDSDLNLTGMKVENTMGLGKGDFAAGVGADSDENAPSPLGGDARMSALAKKIQTHLDKQALPVIQADTANN